MLKTVEGIYQDGQIQFAKLPQDVSDFLKERLRQRSGNF
jgi:hypothetical protein